jgi:phosphatidylserine decarboxylase
MKKYPHPIIAREGWPFIALALAAAVGIHAYAGLGAAAFPWLVVLFMLQFFRDPQRVIPEDPAAVLSPADGRIVSVEKARDPYLERDALKISVFMNVFNAHSNRIPVDGKVTRTLYFPGKFVNAELSKASTDNERAVTCLRTAGGQEVTCVQVAGLIARRILCYAKEGQTYSRGDRFGFIRFGSRVDVYLPLHAVPRVTVGDKVYATETVLAAMQ